MNIKVHPMGITEQIVILLVLMKKDFIIDLELAQLLGLNKMLKIQLLPFPICYHFGPHMVKSRGKRTFNIKLILPKMMNLCYIKSI